jgi:hypothetical protein
LVEINIEQVVFANDSSLPMPQLIDPFTAKFVAIYLKRKVPFSEGFGVSAKRTATRA